MAQVCTYSVKIFFAAIKLQIANFKAQNRSKIRTSGYLRNNKIYSRNYFSLYYFFNKSWMISNSCSAINEIKSFEGTSMFCAFSVILRGI